MTHLNEIQSILKAMEERWSDFEKCGCGEVDTHGVFSYYPLLVKALNVAIDALELFEHYDCKCLPGICCIGCVHRETLADIASILKESEVKND